MSEESVQEFYLENSMPCGKVVTIIFVHGPHHGQSQENTNCFYGNLNAEVQSKNINCIVQGDFNGYVENSIDGYERIHEGPRDGESNIKMEKDS